MEGLCNTGTRYTIRWNYITVVYKHQTEIVLEKRASGSEGVGRVVLVSTTVDPPGQCEKR